MFKEGDIIQCVKVQSETSTINIDEKHLNEFFEVRYYQDHLYIPRVNETWVGIEKSGNNWTYKIWNINHNNFKNMFKLICNVKDLKFLKTNDFKDGQELVLIEPKHILNNKISLHNNGKQFVTDYRVKENHLIGIHLNNPCLENSFILKSDWDLLVSKPKWNYVDLKTLKLGDEFVLVEEIDLKQDCKLQGKLSDTDKFKLFETYKIFSRGNDTKYFKEGSGTSRDVRREQFINKFVTLEEYKRVIQSQPQVIITDEPVELKEVKYYQDFLPLHNVNYDKFILLMKGELFK